MKHMQNATYEAVFHPVITEWREVETWETPTGLLLYCEPDGTYAIMSKDKFILSRQNTKERLVSWGWLPEDVDLKPMATTVEVPQEVFPMKIFYIQRPDITDADLDVLQQKGLLVDTNQTTVTVLGEDKRRIPKRLRPKLISPQPVSMH